jgi:hypothetical protein
MGTRWESVLVRATPESVAELASLALPLCSTVARRVRVDLHAGSHPEAPGVWVLELTGINKNPLQLRQPLDFGEVSGSLSQPVVGLVSRSPQFQLALLAAQHFREATWLLYSDTLAQSSSVTLRGTSIEDCRWMDSDVGEDYGAAAVQGIRGFVPSVRFVDDLLEKWYGSDAIWLAWRLMEARAPLAAPRQLTELAGRS